MFKFVLTILLLVNNASAYVSPLMTLRNNDISIKTSDRRNFMQLCGKSLLASPFMHKLTDIEKATALTPDEVNQINIYETILPSVCYITTDYNVTEKMSQGLDRNPKGVGSGFIYDNEGHIVTNFHVVNKCTNATVKFINNEGIIKEYIPKLVGYDSDKDIAVLKVDTNDFKPIPLSSDKNIKIGQYCYAIGNPFGKPYSFTMGIISGKGRELTSPSGRKISNVIQSDVPINKGNSGGCLLDSSGQLIGINTAILGGDVSTGISLSVSVDTIKTTVDNIIKKGIIEHPTLGIEYFIQLPSKSEALKAGLSYVESGVIILKVAEGSAAASAGLRGLEKKEFGKAALGDVIIAIDNKQIKNADEMLDILDKHNAGDKIKVEVLRGNELSSVKLDVILGHNLDEKVGLKLV
jgi:S1-C subfamily serine protease